MSRRVQQITKRYIPMKEARIHLYQMYKDKYIMYQEVPRRDHQPEVGAFE